MPERLETIKRDSGAVELGYDPSLLQVMDIILWQEGRQAKARRLAADAAGAAVMLPCSSIDVDPSRADVTDRWHDLGMASTELTAAALGQRVRAARKNRGLIQQELARECGVSRKFIGELEAGKENASLGLTLKVINFLDIDLSAKGQQRHRIDFGAQFADTLAARDYPFALRLLGEYASASITAGRPEMTRAPKIDDAEYLTALAGINRWISRKTGSATPSWAARAKPSRTPIFPAERLHPVGDRMKDLIRKDTPAELAELNVWIRERDLATV